MQHEFSHNENSAFTKKKKKEEAWIQIFKETDGSKYIHWNELDKACFQQAK